MSPTVAPASFRHDGKKLGPMITVHHLNQSRSQRVVWLLEELGLDYEIMRYARDPKTMLAPSSLRAVHPLGKSPVVTDGDLALAESDASPMPSPDVSSLDQDGPVRLQRPCKIFSARFLLDGVPVCLEDLQLVFPLRFVVIIECFAADRTAHAL